LNTKRWLILILLLVTLVLATLSFDPKPCTGGDNATYILLSWSILDGKGYRDTYLPGEPAHQSYPFGYPLILAGIELICGRSLFFLKAFSILCLMGAVWLTFEIVLKLKKKTFLAFGIALVTAICPAMLEFSHWVLTEAPYLLVSLLSLFLFIRAPENGKRRFAWLFFAAIAAAASFYVRSNGMMLLSAIILCLLIKRRLLDAVAFTVTFAVLLSPWILYNRSLGGGLGQSVNVFFVLDVYNLDAGRITLIGILGRVLENWKIYFGGVFPGMALPAWFGGEPSYVLAALFTGILGTGLIADLRKSVSLVGIYTLFFLGLAMVWHPSVSSARYLVPIFPILMYYLIIGLNAAWARIIKGNTLTLLIPIYTILVAFYASTLIPSIKMNVEMLKSYCGGDKYAGYDSGWRSFYESADWIRKNSPESSIVVSRKPTLFCLASGRKSYCYQFTHDRDSVLRSVLRADYVLVDRISGTTNHYLIPAIRSYVPERLEFVFVASDSFTCVLKVRR